MDFETLAAVSLPIIFLAFMGFELVAPSGRTMPEVRLWRLIGIVALVVTLAVNALLPLVILPYLPDIALVHLDRIGLWAAVPTVVLTTFFTYWSHRIQHRFDLLWRLGHQLHHSVARVDIASAMIFHPIDVAVQVAMTILAASLLGIAPDTAALAGVLGFSIALYQHWNVRTPRWTGWLIQRPSSTCSTMSVTSTPAISATCRSGTACSAPMPSRTAPISRSASPRGGRGGCSR